MAVLLDRTFDPEEADYFYVPQYSTCFIYPIHGWADYPWFGPPGLGEPPHYDIWTMGTRGASLPQLLNGFVTRVTALVH